MRRVLRSPHRSMLVLLVAMAAGAGHAQDGAVAPGIVATPAAPVILNRAGKQVEGWAIVRYSVLANGTPANIRIVAAAPPVTNSAAIRETVSEWQFTPASADGEAIDWHNNESVVLFAATDAAAPDEFSAAYDAVAALVAEEDYAGAARQNAILLNEVATQRIDIGRALAQSAIIEIGVGNFYAALRPSQLATEPAAAALSDADYFVMLQLQFQIESQLGRTADALATYERISAGYGPEDENPFAIVAAGHEAALASEEFVSAFGSIGSTPWSIDLSRRYFYIDDIDGQINSLIAECDTRRLEISFQPDADYNLPEALGDCSVTVEGESATSFIFVEVMLEEG